MTDEITENVQLDRRSFLGAVGAGTLTASAGCLDFAGDLLPGDDVIEGGFPVMALDTVPDSLNPLVTNTAYSFAIIDNVYTPGTVVHPETQEIIPWAFEDLELNEDNVGTDEPTVVAELREEITFNDGEDLTAEDVEFTVEYILEQEPLGSITVADFTSVERVEAPDPEGTTVEYYFSEADARWLTQVVGTYILPKHIWEDEDDYRVFDPLTDGPNENQIVGSGPMTIDSWQEDEWYELGWRDDEELWQTEAADWIDDDAPFTEGLRVEIYGTSEAKEQSVLDGNSDFPFLSFRVDNALEALDRDELEVSQVPDDGWVHNSYNMRRVPLDCPAFRQLLVRLTDSRWIIDDVFEGVGAREGTYATAEPFTEWRPPHPTNISDVEGIPVPDLEFIGEDGDASVSPDDRDEILDFLQNHDDAVHDYDYGPVESSSVEADEELYVNGEPLSEAHTDNDGNSGQGPIEIVFDPPEESPNRARVSERNVQIMQEAGIAAEQRVLAFNELAQNVFGVENFDIVTIGWSNMGIANVHFNALFHSRAADMESEEETQTFNAMGYAGADDLIDEDLRTFDFDQRQQLVQQILAQIWYDAPTNVLYHNVVLQPFNTNWEGFVDVTGGIANEWSYMNLRLTEEGAEEEGVE